MRFNIFSRQRAWSFIPSDFRESKEYIANPGCGWYRIYTYCLEEAANIVGMEAVCCKEEQLALLLIDIGYYRCSPLGEEALHNLRCILEFFQEKEKELIIRFVYDREGKGMEKEPSDINLVLKHMNQLGSIIREFSHCILTLQGLFIGSWGEMHGSRYLTKDYLKLLVKTLKEVTQESCRLAVRKPSYLRMLISREELLEREEEFGIGLYNDGMLASDNDLGTYGYLPHETAGWEEAWCRADELEFQDKLGKRVLNGGEVVMDNPLNDLEEAVEVLKRTHITYLHSLYDPLVLDKWKRTIYEGPGVFHGINGYDYIGIHLGYRFLIKEASIDKRKGKELLRIQLENTGFACAYEEMLVTVLLKQEGLVISKIPISAHITSLGSNETLNLWAELGTACSGVIEVYLILRRSKDNKIIQLANLGAKEELFLGKLSHS